MYYYTDGINIERGGQREDEQLFDYIFSLRNVFVFVERN